MRVTIKTFSGAVEVSAAVARLPVGKVAVKIGDTELWLDPHEAATLAGEIERGAWRAMRQMQEVTAANVAACLSVVETKRAA